ncbi:transposase [Niabella insulamsoli]|uniref:hypothetical protein n=1 Tax=Niabella insulamsoli TaxID=3144874 RepID=UPI0031FCD36C
MNFAPGCPYHIYNQGNNREVIFRSNEDFLMFLTLVRKLIKPQCEILAWCLMNHHFHFLIYTTDNGCGKIKQGGIEIDRLTNGIRKLLSGYARIYNKKYLRTGSLFRQKTKAKNLLQELPASNSSSSRSDYLYNCFTNIHDNPLKAGLVKHPSEWAFSSFRDYAAIRKGSLCNKNLAAKLCGFSAKHFISL